MALVSLVCVTESEKWLRLAFLVKSFVLLRFSLFTVEPLSLPISLLYLDLYDLGDEAWISYGSFMQTKYLYVLIHI